MKRIVSVAILLVGLGACDEGESVELEGVELTRTEDGIVLVGENGEEIVAEDGNVDMDLPVPMTTVDNFALEPDVSAAWVCESCACTGVFPPICICTGCKEVEEEEQQ